MNKKNDISTTLNQSNNCFFAVTLIIMDTNILFTAIRAALQAGAEIMKVYTDPNADFEIEKKADNSPLTIADRKSHAIIAGWLADTPYPILSEEGKKIPTEERQSWKELWVVDPLDGTKEFIKRNGEFTVNIAYVKNGVPEAGVIYIPVKEELFFADTEKGAYKLSNEDGLLTRINENKEPGCTLEVLIEKAQKLPYPTPHEGFMIVASRSHLNAETEEYIERMKKEHAKVETVSKGSSLKLCLIAEGVADVYPRFAPTMEWDTAAGHAIIRAAGKEVYQANTDKPLVYNKEDLLNPWFIAK